MIAINNSIGKVDLLTNSSTIQRLMLEEYRIEFLTDGQNDSDSLDPIHEVITSDLGEHIAVFYNNPQGILFEFLDGIDDRLSREDNYEVRDIDTLDIVRARVKGRVISDREEIKSLEREYNGE